MIRFFSSGKIVQSGRTINGDGYDEDTRSMIPVRVDPELLDDMYNHWNKDLDNWWNQTLEMMMKWYYLKRIVFPVHA